MIRRLMVGSISFAGRILYWGVWVWWLVELVLSVDGVRPASSLRLWGLFMLAVTVTVIRSLWEWVLGKIRRYDLVGLLCDGLDDPKEPDANTTDDIPEPVEEVPEWNTPVKAWDPTEGPAIPEGWFRQAGIIPPTPHPSSRRPLTPATPKDIVFHPTTVSKERTI